MGPPPLPRLSDFPGVVAELGVRSRGFPEAGKRGGRYPRASAMSHVETHSFLVS
jgi:hypothetical protein